VMVSQFAKTRRFLSNQQFATRKALSGVRLATARSVTCCAWAQALDSFNEEACCATRLPRRSPS
jgi:hypothetical protein